MAKFRYSLDASVAPQPPPTVANVLLRVPTEAGARQELKIQPGVPFTIDDLASIAALEADRKFERVE